MSTIPRIFAALLWGLLVCPSGAGESVSAADATRFASLAVYPGEVSLDHAEDWQNVVAVATRADGMTLDVTDIASWRVEGAGGDAEAAIFERGRLRPGTGGQTRLAARFAGLHAISEVHVHRIDSARPVSFRHDVIPILMRSGCNGGGCHGSSRGKDGFRLSLFGFDPAGDYSRLTREQPTRRLNLAVPAESLMLRKAIGAVTHTGGKRMERESIYYRMLHQWIAAGAPSDVEDAPAVTGLALHPPAAVLGVEGQVQRLIAVASYADGTSRDVTHLAAFQSNNDTTASVDADGRVTSGQRGEAFVLARFDTHSVGSQLLVLPDDEPFEPSDEAPANYIDELVGDKLRTLRIHPGPLASDEQFLRRVTIDIAGRLPTTEERAEFLADASSAKRAARIDQLLAGSEFAKLWALKWAELLLVRTEPNRVDYKPMYLYSRWLSDQIAQDRPLDEMVRELLSASGTTFDTPTTNFFQIDPDPKKIAENVAQTFLGVRIQCAQCHNHPFDRWTMDDYYGFTAFFSRIARKRGEDYREWLVFNRRGGEQRHPIDNRVVPPKFLGGAVVAKSSRDRRELVADWIVAPTNPYFGVSVANRVWAHLFGAGIVEPVDDFRVSNPPSNPALLDALGRRFVESGYDLRQLIHEVCLSNAYQRSCLSRVAPAERGAQAVGAANFAAATPRRIPAEALLDCLSDATGQSDKLPGLPLGGRAVEIADGRAGNFFLKTFGRAKRETVCACESQAKATLSQALHLLNGDTVHHKVIRGGLVKKWLDEGKSTEEVVEALYVRCLCRRPTDDELAAIVAILPDTDRPVQALEDAFWALLNSREFLFNH